MKRPAPFVSLAVALCTGALLAPAAHAGCLSSVGAVGGVTDGASDAGSATPEITRLDVRVDAFCHVVIDPAIAQTDVAPGATVTMYVDTDADPSTGDAGGADRAVRTDGVPGLDGRSVIGRWRRSGPPRFVFDGAHVGPIGSAGFTAALDDLGVIAPAIGVRVESVGAGPYPGVDRVPDASFFRFPLQFETDTPSCVVPKLRGLRRRTARKRLRRAGCNYEIRGGRGRVRRVSHRPGTRTTDTVIVRCRRR